MHFTYYIFKTFYSKLRLNMGEKLPTACVVFSVYIMKQVNGTIFQKASNVFNRFFFSRYKSVLL